jgi:hypothetical protein
MTDFASVLDDMYANTPVTLSDVKEMPTAKAVSTDPALPRYALYIGLGLVFLLLISLVAFRKKDEVIPVPVPMANIQTVAHDPVDIDIPEPVKRARLTFQITEALVTAEESYEDEKISADREDLVLQKYKERMA